MKDRGDVPFWDYQQVAGGDRILVIPGICKFVFKNDVSRSWSAEDTGYRVHAGYPLVSMRYLLWKKLNNEK